MARLRKFFLGKRVFVTGATSFTGSHLVRKLVEHGASVHALISPNRNLLRLSGLIDRLALLTGDICDHGFLRRAIRKVQPEIVYHLASYGVHPGQRDLGRLAEVNVLGTANLIRSLEGIDLQCLVNTGTSAEYGASRAPMNEAQRLKPETFYGATKAAATALVAAFAAQTPARVITLRPFYVYGPAEGFDRVISDGVRTCFEGRPFKLTSYQDRRDFVYIDDVVEAFLLAGSSKFDGHPIVNIGTSTETTLGEVLKTIQTLAGKKMKIIEGAYPFRPWKSICWAADIRQARKILGWKPVVTIQQGIANIVAWERKTASR